MRFAAFTTVAASAGEAVSAADMIENLRQQINLAEELGFETMWLGEHHFGPYGVETFQIRYCSGPTSPPGLPGFAWARWPTSQPGGIRYDWPRTLLSLTT